MDFEKYKLVKENEDDDEGSQIQGLEIPNKRQTTTCFVYVLAFSSAISGFLMGYDIGVVSGSMLLIVPHFHLDTMWTEAIVSATVGAAAVFALSSGYLADVFGRKKIIIFSSIAFATGAVIMGASPTKEILILGRLVAGVGIGFSMSTVSVYIAESAPAHNRGSLVSLCQIFVAIGIFVSSVVVGIFSEVKDVGWRFMFGLSGVAAIIQLIAFLFLPESPRWLVGRGRDVQARAVLERIRGTDDITKEINEIQEAVVEDKLRGDGFVITKVCSTPHVRRALLVGCMLMFFQQMCGINTITYYSATIMKMAGFSSEHSIWLVTAPNSVGLVLTFIGMWLVDRAGRKIITLVSIAGVCVALCILATSFQLAALKAPPVNFTESFSNGTLYNWSCASYTNCDSCTNDVDCGFCFNDTSMGSCLPVDKDNSQHSQFGRCNGTGQSDSSFNFDVGFCPNNFMWMPVVGMVLLVFSFAPGLGPMPLTVNSEIYPLWARSTCSAIAMCVNWSFNLVVSFTFLTFTETITKYGTFWLYAISCVCGFILIAIFLPETKQKTLEEMEQIFMSKNEKLRRQFNVIP
ncbi:proton myo-inositol cotransporter-like [Gigantopelta aegis]|uniref:proton myo-inositol cotransporter-like n=1 Tax=Gigantopelta aegis TaxID=1735272 RepID=UPI001B88C831|nr:proton myo-inositol cotransporter-like [Gigantopelta aegis]XP_041348554.1 proton myo-inositol cotransporter-like [Gigantopelta aegis]XP_041348555.1 proton myo-inositol cotransporter-like [Gigantopelta aegis]XP_041348556.1 proton myo-inositol cotransporter-like [Gigantopelta aegis]XP_041348557.1 proton myo-inositol cotransporter-like [Gigantopelta aegis]